MKKFLLTLCLLISCVTLHAATETVNGITWTYQISSGKAEIYGRYASDYGYIPAIPSSTSGAITIPSILGGYPVTSIGNWAFARCDSLTSVTIPSSVTSIGEGVFSSCSSLTSVKIPEGVTSIGGQAFWGCSRLTSVTIPEGVTEIGFQAFAWCDSLTSVTIPSSVTSIGERAFGGCSSLTSVTIPKGVTSIGGGAFGSCDSLTSFVVDSVNQHYTVINNLLCSKEGKTLIACPGGLTSVTIPEGVTSIGESAFYGCSSLTSVTIPEGVTEIGYLAFEYCSSLTSMTIPEGVTTIGDYAFYYCSSLTSVTIPSSVTEIGVNAFFYCSNLASVTIPEGVTSIGDYTFYSCVSLTSVTIPDSVTSIGSGTFWGCCLTSVTIPEGVTTIGEWAFSNCSGLTSVTIPSSVTSIGRGAFSGVAPETLTAVKKPGGGMSFNNLKTVIIPDGTTMIPNSAFDGCESLTSVTIPSSVTSIGYRAFAWCSGLTLVDFKGKPPSVGYDAFSSISSSAMGYYSLEYASEWEAVIDANGKWNGLKMVLQPAIIFDANGGEGGQMVTQAPSSVLVAPTVTREGYTFVGWLPKVPETVPTNPQTYVAQWVTNEDCFEYEVLEGNSIEITRLTKTSLEEVIIPSTIDGLPVTSIGMDAFSDCAQIVSVILPEGITSLGDYAFYGCLNLKSIELPSTVRSIAISAFEDCETLTRVFFNGEPPSVGKQAFKGLPIEARGVYSSDMATAWEDVIGANGEWNGLTMVAPSALAVRITFDANGGEGGTSITQGYATALTAPSVTREGYFFTGWSPKVPASVPLKDTVYKAYWIPKQYTITFDANGGEGGTSAWLDYATTLTAPQVTREGYTLTGWSPEVPETVPAENMTYTAQWTINQYTMTFDANGGEGGTSVTQDYATPLTAPQVTREGCTLTGWSPEVPETVPAENMTYTAQWTINQYTMTFDAAGGEGGTSVIQDYASALTAPQVTLEGYTFKGWTPAVPSTVPAGNMTYTAQWQVNQYTITFDANGGVGSTTGQFEYGAALIPPRVTHSKYEFMGWLPEVPATVPAGDTTYVAQWGSNPALFTYDIYENEVTITGFAEGVAIAEIIIPRWIEDLPVTMIGNSAFEGCATLSTVVIPEGVINIGRSAFRNCERLTHVTLSSSVSNVYAYAFSGCTNLKSIDFSASPIETVGKDVFANTTAVGTYLPQYASEWMAVISNGKWNGLTMVQKEMATLPEGLPEVTGEWLTNLLEAQDVTSGSITLASGTTAESLEAARLLGITPSISVSGNVATVAAESSFGVSDVVVADNAVSLSVTIAVEAGTLPSVLSLRGSVKLMVCDTLGGDWREVTPDPSQIQLTRISDTEATLSVEQTLDNAYKFFQVIVK